MENPKFLRVQAASEYVRDRYGFTTRRTLDKLACVGGGPLFHKAGRVRLYKPEDLDAWALEKISAPQTSTSDRRDHRAA